MLSLFQGVLLSAAFAGLALALAVLAARSRTVSAVLERLLTLWRSLTHSGRVAAVSLLTICVLYGGSKTNSPPMMMMRPAAPVQLTYAEKKARNWNIRGAWRDSFWLKFAYGWRFPFGTNHLYGVEVISFGQLWPTPFNTNAVASLGSRVEIVPGLSSFGYELTPSNSYRFAWGNAAINRDTNDLVTASLELFRNGDIAVMTNGVTKNIPRELPFDHEGFGQDDEWVEANFTNATDILSLGYAAWVDAQVGTGLTNGLYKLTVTVSDDPPETSFVTVGDFSVAITNAGDYVFLLEKGIEYPLSVFPEDFTNITYSAVDDIRRLRFASPSESESVTRAWTVGIGKFSFEPPALGALGWCLWVPNLQGSPDVGHLGPGDSPKLFTAMVSDCRYAVDATFEWSGGNDEVEIVSPDRQSTLIRIDSMPSWDSTTLSVTATLCGTQLVSTLASLSYGTNETPQVHLALSMPDAILLNSNKADFAKLGKGSFSFSSDIDTNGIVRLSCVSGDERIALWMSSNKVGSVTLPYICDVEDFDGLQFYIEGVKRSEEVSDVMLKAEFLPEDGAAAERESSLTVVEIGKVVLPGAPADGLVVMAGTSVAMEVECKPEAASSLVSTVWRSRRLKGDGTYDEWGFAAGNYNGNAVLYTPAAGGIYQIEVLVAADCGGDVRYYVWDEDEDREIGFAAKGDMKAFGVCDEQWQIDLRNCAKSYLRSTAYGYFKELSGMYGFSSLDVETWKCNYFVAYMVRESGLSLLPQREIYWRKYPPLANDWAGNATINGWACVAVGDKLQPGYVISHPSTVGSGHCGILDFDGGGIAAGKITVNRKFKKWLDGTSRCRRYRNDE